MSTIQADIVKWAAERPAWLQSLLAELAAGAIGEGRLEEITTALIEAGDAEPDLGAGTLSEADLPAATSAAESVLLLAVGEFENVNALVPNETLELSPAGITVVYGDNASGKSGYARPIKAAVSSLHEEAVYPDVFGEDPDPAQRARIRYRRGSQDLECEWPASVAAELSAVSFYDEACGDAYLETESELSYRPSALLLLDQLIEVCNAISKRIDSNLVANSAEAKGLPVAPEGSPAAAFLAGLGGKTTDAEIEVAAKLEPGSDERLAAILTEEARLKATDPHKEKARLGALAREARTIAARVEALEGALDAEALDAARSELEALSVARKASEAASTASFESEPLAGVGSDSWLILWRAARAFSEAAYPGREFPVTEDAHCPLCQQPLGAEGAERLRHFDEFVRNEAAKALEEAEKTVATRVAALEGLAGEPAGQPEARLRLGEADEELATSLDEWSASAEERRLAILAILGGEDPPPQVPALGDSPQGALLARAEKLEGDVGEIDADRFAETTSALASERAEIEGRRLLDAQRKLLGEERDRRKTRETLEAAKKRADTSVISRKIGSLAETYVTAGVRDRFTRESDRLGLERIELKKQSTRKGKVRHKPGLLDPSRTEPVSHVLSEGEQTALGLAGFFTEAHFDPSRSALVLDDPVSSLDHLRRGKVAARLVELAAERQVVVFTHDLEFVVALSAAAANAGVEFTERSIERRGGSKPGVCIDRHPWKAKDVGRRIHELEQQLATIKKGRAAAGQEEYEKSCADWAGKLSEAWERLLHLEIAMPLIELPATHVHPTMLKVISRVTDEDDKQFQSSYSRVSAWARRHDKSPAHNYVAPEPEELEEELAAIRDFLDRVKKYKN